MIKAATSSLATCRHPDVGLGEAALEGQCLGNATPDTFFVLQGVLVLWLPLYTEHSALSDGCTFCRYVRISTFGSRTERGPDQDTPGVRQDTRGSDQDQGTQSMRESQG